MIDSTERARVTRRLSEASTFPIAILRGAAGSGKSVALRHYLAGSGQPYLLYDVAPEHTTLARFVRGLAEALVDVAPGARLSFAGAYERALQSRDTARDLAAWLAEHVASLRTVVVVDNLHVVESDPQTADFLVRLIESSSPGLRWILSCRSGDLLPISSWLAFRHMDVPIEDSELAFSLEDVGALATGVGLAIVEPERAAIFERTQGWATGVTFLLRDAPSQNGAVRAYGPLIDGILAGCDTWELRALLGTCLLPEITPAFLATSAGGAVADAVARLHARAPYLFVRRGEALHYHDLLAAALRARLAESSPRDRSAAIELAAQALRRRGLFADALSLYLEAESLEPVAQILDLHGVELLERGHADVVEAALLKIERAHHAQSPISIALRAIVESRRGRFDTAESWFNAALARAAKDDVRMIEIKYLYACDLMRRFRLDCIPLFAAHAADDAVPRELRASILSALAQALMLDDRPDEALPAIDEALALARESSDLELRARVLGRASYVHQGDTERAREYALTAAESAVAASAFTIATGAYSVLYAMADAAEEPSAALEYLALLRENGLKSGNLQFQFYFLACTLEIEAERGDREPLDRTDAALASFEIHYDDSTSKEALLPANALRATWSGNFEHAYNLLAPTAATQAVPDRTALRYAEVALYAAAAMRPRDANEALASARAALSEIGQPSNRYRRAQLLIALATAIAGNSREAAVLVAGLSGVALPPRLAALLDAVAALIERSGGARNHDAVEAALERLRLHDFGGIARLFEALPFRVVRGRFASTHEGIERTVETASEEIAWNAMQAATLPEERTLAVDLIVDELLQKIAETAAGARAIALQEWLNRTFDGHTDLACLGPLLTATWRQVLHVGRTQGRLGDVATLVAIGEIVESAVRQPRAVRVAASEPLDPIDAVINDLMARLFEKDVITGEHSRAVSSWCTRIARNLGLSAQETALVRRGGLLHDIGKVGTPEEVLNAPRKLTVPEWEIMQRHTVDGAAIVSDVPILEELLPAIRSHHERLDGEGYPDRLRADQIPLSARVVSVADCFNAMIGRRPYRPPMAPSRGIDELQRIAGSHLDPEIVAALIQVVTGQREGA